MLIRADITMTPKKWRIRPVKMTRLKRIADRAMRMLYDRMAKQGRDANGRKLPPLRRRGSYFVTQGNKRNREITTAIAALGARQGRVMIKGEMRDVFFYGGGYPGLKRMLGKRPRRDGELTGTMWRSLTPQFKRTKKGFFLKLHFKGSDKKNKYNAGETDGGKVARRSVRNRDKARLMMYPERTASGGAKGRQQFEMMQLTDAEIATLRDMALDAIEFP